jgi:hypothetical protein
MAVRRGLGGVLGLVVWAGYTPLMQAAMQGHSAIVELLVQRGADVKATTSEGRTAEALALLMGRKVLFDGWHHDDPIQVPPADSEYPITVTVAFLASCVRLCHYEGRYGAVQVVGEGRKACHGNWRGTS